MERVRCAGTMGRGIGKWIDDLQLLDDRAGPPVRDDERQRMLMLRANVDEVNVEPIDLGHEFRQGVQSRLDLAPVVLRRPIVGERLSRRDRTPCESSVTVSRSGHLVAFMRLRNSVSSASGTLKRKGRTAVGVVSWVWVCITVLLCVGTLQIGRLMGAVRQQGTSPSNDMMPTVSRLRHHIV